MTEDGDHTLIDTPRPLGHSNGSKPDDANESNVVSFEAPANAERSPENLALLVLHSLDDAKAEDVTDIDMTGKSALADRMIVASGRSQRHVSAVADRLLRDMKVGGYGSPKVEGMPACDWVLLDAGDVIVHVFRPEVREFYNLEKMWSAPVAEASRIHPLEA